MDTMRIDLNLLLTLEALLTEQNVTRAAARLNLSQPAVSAQLNRLRDLFHDPLLIPARRGMTPTVKALELLNPLRESLDKLRNTVHSYQTFNPESARLNVTLACTDYIQATVIMPLVLTLRNKAPGVRIAVRHYHPAQLEQQLVSGEVDIAIITPSALDSSLRICHLFNETYVLIGRQGHSAVKNPLSMEDFVQLEQVTVSLSGGSFTTPIDEVLSAFGLQRKVVMSAASFLFVPEIVLASDLVALVPRRLLQNQQQRLAIIEVPWFTEQFDVSMVWHERTHGHPGHQWVRNLIVEMNGKNDAGN